jgi:uncharacterized membrane protein (UPF0136 family)
VRYAQYSSLILGIALGTAFVVTSSALAPHWVLGVDRGLSLILLVKIEQRALRTEKRLPVTVVGMGVKAGLEGSESVFRSTPRLPWDW